jgi:predicted negative regulator of RcsB-dependent stress response
MKKEELEKLTDSQKIDYLIKKVNEIDKTINPPFWKTFLKWFIANFWTLLSLAIIGYFLWQVWEMVQAVQAQIDSVKGQVDGLRGAVSAQFKGMGEALGSLPSIDINRFKFWE